MAVDGGLVVKELQEMRDNGHMYELQDKWFGFRMNIPSEGYLPAGAL